MTDVDARLRNAWDAGTASGLDRAAELLAAEGADEATILGALERVLLEVRAAGADDETEERVMGVMDRLTGWCHESNHIKARRADLPTTDEIANLPRWARVAFAARCTRRVLPLYLATLTDDPDHHAVMRDLSDAVAFREATAAHRPLIVTRTVTEESGTWTPEWEVTDRTVYPVAETAFQVALAVSSVAHADQPEQALAAALQAVAAARPYFDILPLIRSDLDHLTRLAQEQKWSDDTPVPPEVFGPLWPDGPPLGWQGNARSSLQNEMPEGILARARNQTLHPTSQTGQPNRG